MTEIETLIASAQRFVSQWVESGKPLSDLARQIGVTEGALRHIRSGRNQPGILLLKLLEPLIKAQDTPGAGGKSAA